MNLEKDDQPVVLNISLLYGLLGEKLTRIDIFHKQNIYTSAKNGRSQGSFEFGKLAKLF